MSVQLGTVAPLGFDEFPPGPWLACFRELGCTVVQAVRNKKREVSLQEMLDGLAAGGLPCDSLHGIFEEPHDLSSPDDVKRSRTVDTYKAEGDLCLKLGGKLVVAHCSNWSEKPASGAEHGIRVAQLRKSIADLARHGRQAGVKYAFENLPALYPMGDNVTELAGLLRDENSESVGMCFDAGHANTVGNVAAQVAQTQGQIIYVHMSDNTGKQDDHQMPTTGGIDFESVARALATVNYSGTMLMEVFYDLERLKSLVEPGLIAKLARIVALANGQD